MAHKVIHSQGATVQPGRTVEVAPLTVRPCLPAPPAWVRPQPSTSYSSTTVLHPGRRQRYRPALPLTVAPVFGHRGDVESQAPVQPAHFDIALSVALAGAAFEAYLEPTGAEGFQQLAINGSKVTYTDRNFLTENYQGVLQVKLVRANNLWPANVDGTSDPYVTISVANCSVRSEVLPRTLDPEWNETYWMYIKDPASDVMRVRLFDAEGARSDQDLGLVMIGMSVLVSGEKQTYTLPLKGPGAGSGATITLELRYLRFSESDPGLVEHVTASGMAAGAGALSNMAQAAEQVTVVGLMQTVINTQQDQPQQQFATTDTAASSGQAGGGDGSPAAGPLSGLQEAVMKAMSDLNREAAEQMEQESKAAAGDAEAAAHIAVSEEEVPNPWKVLAAMAGKALDGTFTPVAFVENTETDTQVWLYCNVEEKEAIIAFRGTEQVKWKDIATDLNLAPCSLNPERVDSNASLPFTMRIMRSVLKQDAGEEMVHTGFLTAYDSVRPQVFSLLDLITGTGEKGVWRVLVTGHSLGGALATLCAYELAARQGPARRAQQVSLYTYGAPRVGNKTFAKRYNKLVPDSWRITNSNDIIPSVPRLMGYCHIGHGVRLAADGSLMVRAESRDVFGEGKGGADVIQELVKKVAEEARPWDEVYEEIASREMELFSTLVDGRGLEEHMETFYLASLQQAILLGSKEGGQANTTSTTSKAVKAVEALTTAAAIKAAADGKGVQ